jgi:hypothetical protein
LFDTADGGAGYASSIGRHILLVATQMFAGLECPADCDKACHHCLITYDTQHQASLLDRRLARDWLTAAFPSLLALPEAMRLLGPASVFETQPLFQALDRALQDSAATGVRIFFGGDAVNWDPAFGELRQRIAGWAGRSLDVELLVYQATFAALDDELRGLITSLVRGLGLTLATVGDEQRGANAWVIAEVRGAAITRWASAEQRVCELGESWGQAGDQPIIVATGLPQTIDSTPVVIEPISAMQAVTDVDIDINDELHGAGSEFGERFWIHVLARHDGLRQLLERDQLTAIHYSDRYLKNPLGVTLLLQVLYALDQRYPNCYARASTRIKIEQNHREHRSRQAMVWDDWLDDRDREQAIEQAFAYVDLGVQVGTYDRRHMPHFRVLELRFTDGQVARLRLDEGWGYWEAESGYGARFDFRASAEEQGEAIAEWRGNLVRRFKQHPTALVLSLR